MPVYQYECSECGSFTMLRPMAECFLPGCCPGCGSDAQREISAPHLGNLSSDANRAHAVNERSAHAPRRSGGHVHSASCSCGSGKKTAASAAKSFPGARPWMISH